MFLVVANILGLLHSHFVFSFFFHLVTQLVHVFCFSDYFSEVVIAAGVFVLCAAGYIFDRFCFSFFSVSSSLVVGQGEGEEVVSGVSAGLCC